jgi:hypothetical protein
MNDQEWQEFRMRYLNENHIYLPDDEYTRKRFEDSRVVEKVEQSQSLLEAYIDPVETVVTDTSSATETISASRMREAMRRKREGV